MATRPVFITKFDKELFTKEDIVFTYNSGFSIIQKRKNIKSIHSEFLKKYPSRKILEVSSKSMDNIGVELSAFNLHVTKEKTVESVFQSSKVFENGGPFKDISILSSKEAKRDPRLKNNGELIYFVLNNKKFKLDPKTLFYNWLYINTLNMYPNLISGVIKYDAFTDIEYNPKKSINCQAEAVSIFVSLYKKDLINEALKDINNFTKIVYPEFKIQKV